MLATGVLSAGAAASFSVFSWEGLVTFWKKLPKMEARLDFLSVSSFFSSFFSSFSSSFFSPSTGAAGSVSEWLV